MSRGAFVVVAAGNDFLTAIRSSARADVAPQIDGVVSVGAIGRDRCSARSTRRTGAYVELAAPGGDSRRGGIGRPASCSRPSTST